MFIMNLDHVVTLSESSDMEMIAMYQRYLRDAEKDNNNQAKMSRKMGYLGNIHDTKQLLEKIFKNPSNNNS